MGQSMRILGIMSGSSLDGIDMALCEFSGFGSEFKWKIIRSSCLSLSEKWIKRLSDLPKASAIELSKTDFEFSYLIAEKLKQFLGDETVDYIASHGHTIFHFPGEKSTCQIGNGGAIAASTGIPVICDFRSTDIGLGGQGAPIVAFFDQYVFGSFDYLINFGGIVNVTVNHPGEVKAFDIGPCNQILNYLSRQAGYAFDLNGKMAERGRIVPELLEELLEVSYYKLSFPKTLDNTQVASVFFPIFESHKCSVADKLRTAVELIALSVKNQLDELSAKNESTMQQALMTGGGANNIYLIDRLKALIPNIELVVPNPELIEFKEALMIAFLGYFRVNRKINILASATGAQRDSIGGAIYLG